MSQAEDTCANIAISNSLADPDLVAGESFGVRMNVGTAGSNDVPAIGFSMVGVISDEAFGGSGRLTGSAAIGFSGDQRGSRLGLQLSW